MSGYRTLHRHTEGQNNTNEASQQSDISTTSSSCPVFAVNFSPCQQTHVSKTTNAANANAQLKAPTRILTSSADGLIRAYSITDKSIKADVLDAAALSMKLEQVMLTSSDAQYDDSGENQESILGLGCAALSVIRNYVGEDTSAGEEIAAAMQLDGHVAIWKRAEQPAYPDSEASKNDAASTSASAISSPTVLKPEAELDIRGSTGTTMLLIPPQTTGYSRHGVVIMVGNLDGSVSFICAGFGIPDSSKCNDTSKCSERGVVLDNIGSGNSIPLSLAVHPLNHLTFAVGRKDGTIDIYSAAGKGNGNGNGYGHGDDLYGQIRRCHHLTQHAGKPVRALIFTPDGSLLISGCDDGHIYIHDTSSFRQNDTIRMVAAIHNAHKGYILSVAVLPDSKRFVTSSADKTVKVWNVGTPNSGPVHTFDTGHEGMIWDISSSHDGHGRRCVSCSDDGFVQVYSCEE